MNNARRTTTYAVAAAIGIGVLVVALTAGLGVQPPAANGNSQVTSNDDIAGSKIHDIESETRIAGEQSFAAETSDTDTDIDSTLHVTGTASKKVSPDKVSVTVGVETQEAVAKDAAAKNSEIMNAVIAGLQELGLDTKQIGTSYYNIYPVYEYPPIVMDEIVPPYQNPVLVGYRVTNTITVTVPASEDVGRIIDMATGAGANEVQGVNYFVSDEVQQKISDELIEMAVLNAKAKAEKALTPLGMQIAGVQSINLSDVYYPFYDYKGGFYAAEAAAAPTPILPSEQQVSASVSVTFLIGPR